MKAASGATNDEMGHVAEVPWATCLRPHESTDGHLRLLPTLGCKLCGGDGDPPWAVRKRANANVAPSGDHVGSTSACSLLVRRTGAVPSAFIM